MELCLCIWHGQARKYSSYVPETRPESPSRDQNRHGDALGITHAVYSLAMTQGLRPTAAGTEFAGMKYVGYFPELDCTIPMWVYVGFSCISVSP